MKILVSGICGFVGRCLAVELQQRLGADVTGFDNYIRPGSELNRTWLRQQGIRVFHADVRSASDMELLPPVDWVVDAAANPVVTAGVVGGTSSRQLVEHNLNGTINLLEHCKRVKAGLFLLSTSRVYSIEPLANLPMRVVGQAYVPEPFAPGADCSVSGFKSQPSSLVPGLSPAGVSELFPTATPLSLYGSTKLASEIMALEYGATFGFPVWVNRCGVIGGAGQFGRADQGIFSFWVHSWTQRRALKFIGFDGLGHQVRDCLHPSDLAALMAIQIVEPTDSAKPRICNCGGGLENSLSLAQVSDWCRAQLGPHDVGHEPRTRPFDVPWLVLDAALARSTWGWSPRRTVWSVLEEIAQHARVHPDWLDLSTL